MFPWSVSVLRTEDEKVRVLRIFGIPDLADPNNLVLGLC